VVEFCVLGPLRVRGDDGAERIVGGARQQVLLAALLVRAGHVVSTDTLAGYLWDGAPPPSARNRAKLRDAAAAPTGAGGGCVPDYQAVGLPDGR
jgi:DNA-binding SARP family transcriptional activator